jgi:gliding motility-associated-like protein
MKILLFLTSILISTIGLSQPITVSSTSYTVPQLVNNVLINSTCVSATNVTWSTGSNFGSTNGIGFFQNTNPNFQMQSGVVLSTGNAVNAVGPNSSLLNDGVASWPGDTNLETTLAAAGIPMVSKNATVLEFDFTPISPNFSFDFIFASEEYGNFQCLYSDAFAFLLTNTITGITTNLAVVPSTNTPISVVTIRDFQYNSSCQSVNAQYFGSFNGGSAAANSATNFNGQTKVLTASSVLTAGVPYHIKLVIADRSDPQSDSAIFLSSNSFNVGQDVLGLDLTIANNGALCFGTNHTIDTGLSTATYTFVWKKDGVVLPSETGSSLIVSQTGTYEVTYDNLFDTCVPFIDSVIIEFNPQIISPNPINIFRCDSGTPTRDFNLDLNTSRVKQGLNPLTSVSYHISQNDANNNINPLPLLYNSPSGQIIYVRIQLPNSNCFIVKSFQLLFAPPPVANLAPNLIRCEIIFGSNNSNFNLNLQLTAVLGSQSPNVYQVLFFTSLINANNNINAIPTNNYPFYQSVNATLYVRIQNRSDPACYSITSFTLTVNPLPIVTILENVIVCTDYTLLPLTNGNYFTSSNGNGLPLFAGNVIIETQTIYIFNQPGGPGTCAANSSFIVTIVDEDSLAPVDLTRCGSYTLPALTYGNYYTGPSATGTVITFGTVISASQTIYYYFTTTAPAPICVVDSNFSVTILPNIEVGNRADVFECTSHILPALSLGNYFTGSGGTGTQLIDGTAITSSQTIYIYATTSRLPPCTDEDSFEVIIGITQPANISQCNGYTLPQLPIGNYFTGPAGTGQQIPAGTIINTNSTVYIYAQTTSGSSNCTDNLFFTLTIAQPQIDVMTDISVCETYTLPALTNGEYFAGVDGTGAPMYAGDVIISTQTIYIFRRLDASCFNQSSFTVTINPIPVIDSRSDIDIFDQYVLTPLTVGNYYTGPNATGTLLTAGTIITSSQSIYIYAISNSTPACSIQNSFQINIFSAIADSLPSVIVCVSYTLPTLTANNHYYTQTGGLNGLGTEILPGTIITSNQTIYIFKQTFIRSDFSDIGETFFTVTIIDTPIANPVPVSMRTTCDLDGTNDGIVNFNLSTLSATILGTQTGSEFTITYYQSLANATTASNPVTSSTQTLVYARVSNTLAPNCYDVIPISIIVNKLPEPTPVDGIICIDSETGTVLNPYTMYSGLTTATYTFVWTNESGNTVGTGSNYQAILAGQYTLLVTNNATGCANAVTVTVSPSEPAFVTYEVSPDFVNSQSITVIATGQGSNFEYQLNDGPFQDSNIFENVPSGIHSITVRDKNGCGSTTIQALVVNYPKYFTPNGDGYNDTWNIFDLSNDLSATVVIYDRFGKILTQIKTSNSGWDGTYNGRQMPSDDYWFSVSYTDEDQVAQEFKAHFAMKR